MRTWPGQGRRPMPSRSSLSAICIRQAPPTTGYLERFDLGSYAFREGHVYRVPRRVAEVLIAWNYAVPVEDAGESPLDEAES